MLTTINTKGDLLDKYSYLLLEHGHLPLYILHGCNAQGVMGSGVAKQIKTKYPEAYTAYKQLYNSMPKDQLIGRYCIASVYDNLSIINAITQEKYGTDGKRYTSYDAVSEVCNELAQQFGNDEVVIAIPKKFASDRGGACWKTIKQLIKSEFKDKNIILYIVEYNK